VPWHKQYTLAQNMQFPKWAIFPGLASSKWVLRRGTINKQFLKVRHKGRDKPISRAPTTCCPADKVLGTLIEGIGCGRQPEAVLCPCGSRMRSQGLKSKPLVTILGRLDYRRSLFQCPECDQTRYPGDEQLDVVKTTRSPGLRRMMARAGGQSTFASSSRGVRKPAR